MLALLKSKKQADGGLYRMEPAGRGAGQQVDGATATAKDKDTLPKTGGMSFGLALKLKTNAKKNATRKLRDGWSKKKSCCDCQPMIKNEERVMGLTYYRPIVGQRGLCMGVSSGLHTWRLRFEGDNHIAFGVAGGAYQNWWKNGQCWGMSLWDRRICGAGRLAKRTDNQGPDEFSVPCDACVTVDCEAHTLSFSVGRLDLGVVCMLPASGQRLSVAVATGRDACNATLVSYEHEAKEVVEEKGIEVNPDEDILLMDDLHKQKLLGI